MKPTGRAVVLSGDGTYEIRTFEKPSPLPEVFTLDGFDQAMMLLKREHRERDAIRVTIHC